MARTGSGSGQLQYYAAKRQRQIFRTAEKEIQRRKDMRDHHHQHVGTTKEQDEGGEWVIAGNLLHNRKLQTKTRDPPKLFTLHANSCEKTETENIVEDTLLIEDDPHDDETRTTLTATTTTTTTTMTDRAPHSMSEQVIQPRESTTDLRTDESSSTSGSMKSITYHRKGGESNTSSSGSMSLRTMDSTTAELRKNQSDYSVTDLRKDDSDCSSITNLRKDGSDYSPSDLRKDQSGSVCLQATMTSLSSGDCGGTQDWQDGLDLIEKVRVTVTEDDGITVTEGEEDSRSNLSVGLKRVLSSTEAVSMAKASINQLLKIEHDDEQKEQESEEERRALHRLNKILMAIVKTNDSDDDYSGDHQHTNRSDDNRAQATNGSQFTGPLQSSKEVVFMPLMENDHLEIAVAPSDELENREMGTDKERISRSHHETEKTENCSQLEKYNNASTTRVLKESNLLDFILEPRKRRHQATTTLSSQVVYDRLMELAAKIEMAEGGGEERRSHHKSTEFVSVCQHLFQNFTDDRLLEMISLDGEEVCSNVVIVPPSPTTSKTCDMTGAPTPAAGDARTARRTTDSVTKNMAAVMAELDMVVAIVQENLSNTRDLEAVECISPTNQVREYSTSNSPQPTLPPPPPLRQLQEDPQKQSHQRPISSRQSREQQHQFQEFTEGDPAEGVNYQEESTAPFPDVRLRPVAKCSASHAFQQKKVGKLQNEEQQQQDLYQQQHSISSDSGILLYRDGDSNSSLSSLDDMKSMFQNVEPPDLSTQFNALNFLSSWCTGTSQKKPFSSNSASTTPGVTTKTATVEEDNNVDTVKRTGSDNSNSTQYYCSIGSGMYRKQQQGGNEESGGVFASWCASL